MKKILLFLMLFSMAGFVACNKDDGSTDDGTTKTDDTNTGKKYATPDGLRKLFAGEPSDSFVWVGTQLFRSNYDAVAQDFGEETDITASANFEKEKMWFKYDKEQTDRISGFYKYVAAVGNCWWIDPNGKSQLNWELHTGNVDTLFINFNEGYPARRDFVVLDADGTTFEWYWEYSQGGQKRRDRMIWTRE